MITGVRVEVKHPGQCGKAGVMRVFGCHELWHLFVLVGSACHFWAVLRYIAPLA